MPTRRTLLAGALALPVAARAASGPPLRIACDLPTGRIDPLTVSQTGGLLLLAQTGEFLARVRPDNSLAPALATSWQRNENATIWRFTLREGVRFHNGAPLTAADVAATIDRLADPHRASNALSVFRGVLSPGGARPLDAHHVEFHLDAPDANFPYAVSSDNYNAIILPADFSGVWEKTFLGTGPFRLENYTPTLGASFVRNPDWWGGDVRPARTEFLFYADQQPQILALRDGQVDIVAQFVVQGARGLIADPRFRVLRLRSAAHRQIHMRTDRPPFADARVRQAIALTLDRPAILSGLFRNLAELGNDSPCAPVYADTDRAVPQRQQNLAAAREKLHQAGHANGFRATLTTERLQEIPDLAVVLQQSCAAIGIELALRVEDPQRYYGTAQPGASDWLDSEMGITDYGHRGVPDVILRAALTTGGAWNAAHFSNQKYDALVGQFRAASGPERQQASAAIQGLLLQETPVIIPYFFDFLVATAPEIRGVEASAIGQLFLAGVEHGA